MADATIDSVDLTASPSMQTKMPCSDGTGAPVTISVGQILALGPTLGADDNYMTDAEKTKLAGIATGAEVNVQADWNASTGDAAILNKPEIPSISGLLNEAAHDALDHSGLPGVPALYTLPVASTTVLGGVKVDGTTVTISNGVISSNGGSGNLRVADVLTSETISSWATAGLSNIAYKFSAQIITAAAGSILMQINSGNPAGSEIHLSGNSTTWGGGSGTSIAEVAYSFEAGDNIGIEGTVYPDGSSVKVDAKTTVKRTNATLIIYWYHLSFANTAIDKLELELTNGIAAGSTITIDKVRA